MTTDTIRSLLKAGQWDKASDALRTEEKGQGATAETTFLQGYLMELTYDREGAMALYEKALVADAGHVEATFRAAWLADQAGGDEEAIALYEQCTSAEQVPVNALINLALLYEDEGLHRRAEACLQTVLAEQPNHERARRFLKSVQSSATTQLDDRGPREPDHRNAMFDMPISDFELSVRSRNCLRQMNLRTIGDLVRTSEAELLAYKNFGETSLNEIKNMLSQKGLRLGQEIRPATPIEPEEASEQPPVDLNLHLLRPVVELELSVRSRKCLQRLGISTIGDLIQRSESELLSNKNFGQTSLHEIRQQLGQLGLSLRKRP